MRSRPALFALALASVLTAGCGPGADTPDGFALVVRFDSSVDVAVVDSLRLRFQPPIDTRFEAQPDATFEGGAIVVQVDANGSLVVLVDGEHVRAHATPSADGNQSLYELELWAEDPAMRDGPLVIGSVLREGEVIADGTVYLTAWPPPLGATTQIAMRCTTEATTTGRCRP